MMIISRTIMVDNIINFIFLLLKLKIIAFREFSAQLINITRFPLYLFQKLSYPSREIQPFETQR